MFLIGQWVSYRQTPAYVVEVNDIEGKYLIHAPSISSQTYWIPGEYLKQNEEIHLYEEDVHELKVVAIKTGDLVWYRELSEQHS